MALRIPGLFVPSIVFLGRIYKVQGGNDEPELAINGGLAGGMQFFSIFFKSRNVL